MHGTGKSSHSLLKVARRAKETLLIFFIFVGGDSNDKPLASRSLGRLSSEGCWSTILYWTGPLRRSRCTSQCLNFDGYIATISMSRSTCFRLDVLAALGLLQYRPSSV